MFSQHPSRRRVAGWPIPALHSAARSQDQEDLIMEKDTRRRAAVGSLSFIATAALTVVAAADASAAQRNVAAGSKRLESSRMQAPARAQLSEAMQLMRKADGQGRVEVAVSLNTAAVGELENT